MPNHMHYPNQTDMEVPLLRALVKRGGSVWFSFKGDELEEELADEFHLSEEELNFASPEINSKGHRKWRSVIQYVRWALVKKGEIDKSVRDRWTVTRSGYRRLHMKPPPSAPNK